MTASISWRQRLLGSLQGQLELATFLSLFAGFTLASSSSLLLSDVNLRRHHHMQVMRQAEALNLCLDSARGLPGHAQIEDCLTRFSGWGHFFWMRTPQGKWLLPSPSVASLPLPLLDRSKQIFRTVLKSDVAHDAPHHADSDQHAGTHAMGGPSEIVEIGSTDYIVHQHSNLPSGELLFTAEDVTSYVNVDSQFLLVLIGVWGGSLLFAVIAVRLLVGRVMRPLLLLTSQADLVTADNLASQRVSIEAAPREVRQLESSFNHLILRLSQALDNQKQFAGAVSHELRTPLTVIQGYLKRVLRRSENLTDQQRKALLTVEEESLRVTRLVSHLLDLSRGDAGRLDLDLEPVQLLPLLQALVQGATPALARSIELQLSDPIHFRDVCVRANADRLRQVLLNLVENAAKYSPDSSPIKIGVSDSDALVSISVADQGIGIPSADIPHVFDRFYRGGNATDVGGSGVGLSVVKLLVEAMNGSVRVASQPGAGTVFTVDLPKVPASDPSHFS